MTALSTHLYRTRGRRVYITNIVPCITILDSLHRLYHQCPIFAREIFTTFVETNSSFTRREGIKIFTLQNVYTKRVIQVYFSLSFPF